MSQISKISKNNTVVLDNRDGSKSVILHKTEIIRWWPADRKLRLDTGGWYTSTTRTRMQQAFNEWGLPVRVGFTQKANKAEVYAADGSTVSVHPFTRADICHLNY